jgi:hypothetical protein
MADRVLVWNQRARGESGVLDEGRRFAVAHGMTVTGGPFAGLRYPDGSIDEIDAPIEKLSGTYESELHPAIAEAIGRKPKLFVNIGTADGYYAVGFLLRCRTPTHGFEIAPRARRLTNRVAKLNGVKLTLHRAATSRKVRALDLEDAFVLADCEGAEAEIFDKAAVAALRHAFLVIETHEWARPGVEEVLKTRFSQTHSVEFVLGTTPQPLRVDEGRWAICRPG